KTDRHYHKALKLIFFALQTGNYNRRKIMNVSRVDHIGIAVTNLDDTIKFYQEVLGIECQGTEVVEDQKVKVAFFPVGDTELEFLESTSPDGPIAKFIEKNGGRGG